jgi:hypothetical protein
VNGAQLSPALLIVFAFKRQKVRIGKRKNVASFFRCFKRLKPFKTKKKQEICCQKAFKKRKAGNVVSVKTEHIACSKGWFTW